MFRIEGWRDEVLFPGQPGLRRRVIRFRVGDSIGIIASVNATTATLMRLFQRPSLRWNPGLEGGCRWSRGWHRQIQRCAAAPVPACRSEGIFPARQYDSGNDGRLRRLHIRSRRDGRPIPPRKSRTSTEESGFDYGLSVDHVILGVSGRMRSAPRRARSGPSGLESPAGDDL